VRYMCPASHWQSAPVAKSRHSRVIDEVAEVRRSAAKIMKILIYSTNFAPEPTGIGKYSGDMAAWFAARGHEVRAVCAPPYYPAWKIDPRYRGSGYRRESWQGVDVWRAPIWVPQVPNGLTRVLHLLSFAFTSFPLVLRQIFWGPDLVICVAPALVCAPAAWLAARVCGAQAWLHMQDFEVDLAFRMNMLRGSFLKRAVLRMERIVLRRFDVVSTISGRMAERLLVKGVDPQRIKYFPNWVDMAHINPACGRGAYRTRLGIAPDAVVVLFSGTLGGKQGLMVIPDAARLLLRRADIVFVICGDGVMKPDLEAASADLPNVKLIPLQPLERLGEFLCMADIHLLPQSAGAADLVLPSKLAGMFASGRPVIATCSAGTELHGIASQCGRVVPPQDSAALAEAICDLADDSAARSSLGQAARVYAEINFERDAILGRSFAALDGTEEQVPNVA
jgi:colanic acid biosynthesis glycosyl transferase WcaI